MVMANFCVVVYAVVYAVVYVVVYVVVSCYLFWIFIHVSVLLCC